MAATLERQRAPALDPDAIQTLRQVGALAGESGTATVRHLRIVLEQPPDTEAPPAELNLAPDLQRLLHRAHTLAAEAQSRRLEALIQASRPHARG
jgi:hypothetical protein